MQNHLITWAVLVPWLGAALQSFEALRGRFSARVMAIASSLLGSGIAWILLLRLPSEAPGASANEVFPWLGAFSISYHVALDGLSAPFFFLSSIIFPLLLVYEWNREAGQRGLFALFLILQGAAFGFTCSQDLFLQFFFWALMTLPTYLLMGVWGGEERESSAFRTTISSVISNGLILGALVLVYFSIEPHTFELQAFEGARLKNSIIIIMGQEWSVSVITFSLVAAGLALRMGLWPFHGWFYSGARESIPSVVIFQSAIGIPLSLFMLIRWGFGVLPDIMKSASHGIVIVGAISVIAGTASCVSQKTLRGLLAYLRVVATGLALMGIGSLDSRGLVGAVFQETVFSFGLAAFGFFVGMYESRLKTDAFGEAAKESRVRSVSYSAPMAASLVGFVLASLLSFPGMGGFVGTALLVLGSFGAHPAWLAVIGLGFMLCAYSLLLMYREIFWGPQESRKTLFADFSLREQWVIIPLVFLLLTTGIYPKPLLDVVRPTVLTLLSLAE